jgi:hypothetical protein
MPRYLRMHGIAALIGEALSKMMRRSGLEMHRALRGLSLLRRAWRGSRVRSPRYECIDELDPRLLDDVGLAGEPMESANLWPSSRII